MSDIANRMTGNTKNKVHVYALRVAAAVFVAVLSALAAGFACACSKRVDISFSTESLRILVGDSRDLFPYVVFSPATADDKEITLSADGDCLEIDGTSVTAVRSGDVTVTAKSHGGGEASIRITAEYRTANGISISADGDTVQNLSDPAAPSAIEFTARFDEYVDPAAVASWSINGAHVADGNTFVYAPPSFGEFDISASVQDVSDSVTVKVYRETAAVASYDGALRQTNDFSPCVFAVKEQIDTRNPRSITEWSVNGARASSAQVFEFVPPSSGTYEITVKVNGKKRTFASGADCAVITAVGDRVPTVSEIAFDDTDGVFVKWRDGGHIRSVSITAPSGDRTVYSRSDSLYSQRFSAGAFDATDIIKVCAADGEEAGKYTVKLTADGQSAEYEFWQYPYKASEYIGEKALCNNKFLSDDGQTREWIRELYACGRRSGKAYVARDYDAERALDVAKSAAELCGMPCTRAEVTGSIVSLYFGEYFNAPVKSSVRAYTRAIYSSLPHIEYDAAARRSGSYRLAVDRAAKKIAVTDSEQLLIAALCGYSPVPTQSGSAQTVYSAARTALLNIIGASYTDAQKVHAVYDWLTWVCVRPTVEDADGSCRFLEGVFGGRSIDATGAVSSEGAAKAFALMCGMEGIECVICSQTSGSSVYFWNKVKLSEVWYNVDVYGGMAPSGSTPSSHKTLFLSDAQAAVYGLSCSEAPEAVDDGGVYYLQKNTFDGQYFDAFVDLSEKDGYNIIKAAVFSAFDGQRRNSVSLIGIGGVTTVSPCNYFGAEFSLDGRLSAEEVQAVKDAVLRAVGEYGTEVLSARFSADTVKTHFTDGDRILHVTAPKPSGVI
ncbi:MAG: hypothetical protein NC184_07450 [Roseburia sp.]|nr:hypothetical protein [Roseburia sp.]